MNPIEEALEILQALMDGGRYPACLVRVHHLLSLAHERYFTGEDDRATLAAFPDDEHVRIVEDLPF